MASDETPKVTLTVEQATELVKVLDAGTVQELAEARDRLRHLFALPPFALKE